ncbi:hypothetical protein ACQJBY_030996 [Aegilops geniculata]
MATTTSSAALLIALVALAGLADVLAVHAHAALAVKTTTTERPTAMELDGKMQCMMGCFTTVMFCAFKCMIPCVVACPMLPLCITNCDLKTLGCMLRCGMMPSPKPKPKPKPKPPAPPAPSLHLDAHKITSTHD